MTSVGSPSKVHADPPSSLDSSTHFGPSHQSLPYCISLSLRALLLIAARADQITLLPSDIPPGMKSEVPLFFLKALHLCLVLSVSPLLLWLRWLYSVLQELQLLCPQSLCRCLRLGCYPGILMAGSSLPFRDTSLLAV